MDRAQVGVLEEANKVRLRRLLERGDGRRLKAQVGLKVLSDLANKALERQLADQQLSRLLELADLTERHSSWAKAVRLLDAGARRRRLAGGLGRDVLARRLMDYVTI